VSWSVLLVGLGQIGMGYDNSPLLEDAVYSHAKAFSSHPDFHLECAVDPDPSKRSAFTDRYGVTAYSDTHDALANHRVDLAIIATPTVNHLNQIETILANGKVRLLLCEKPLSNSLDESRYIVRICKDRGVLLFVNYIRRSEPGVLEVMRRIQQDDIMRPIKAVTWYSKGFLHNGSHFLNLLEYWLGSVRGFQVIRSRPVGDSRQAIERPDVYINFEFGEAIFLALHEKNFTYHSIEMLALNGRLIYHSGGRFITWSPGTPAPDAHGYRSLSESCEEIYSELTKYQWHVASEVSKAMKGKAAHLCDGETALTTSENIHMILEKANELR